MPSLWYRYSLIYSTLHLGSYLLTGKNLLAPSRGQLNKPGGETPARSPPRHPLCVTYYDEIATKTPTTPPPHYLSSLIRLNLRDDSKIALTTRRMSLRCFSSVLILALLALPFASGLAVPLPSGNRLVSTSTLRTIAKARLDARGGGAEKKAPVAIPSVSKVTSSISDGYRARVAADSNFLVKSFLEVALAAGTQLAAEFNRRGAAGCLTEIDFVVAGVLTAIAGKYYSSWRVAPTVTPDEDTSDSNKKDGSVTPTDEEGGFWSTKVPTNAFQPYHLDGTTRPTLLERLAALVAPIPALFRAGVIASAIGYGLTSLLISLRTLLVPDYTAQTVSVNIIHACLYTGAFMSIVSNIRYQLLQGIIEPHIIDRYFRKWPPLRAALTFGVRLANGLLGSMIAIAGMKYFGLQKLK